MAGFDLTALATSLGDYSREHSKELFARTLYTAGERQPEQPRHWLDTVRRGFFKDEQAFARMLVNLQVHERSTTVTEQTATPITIEGALRKLRDMETIFSITPESLENTWLDEMVMMARKFRDQPEYSDVEFVPWLTEYLVGKFLEEFYLNTVWGGVYVSGFTYAQSWAAAADGFLKVVTDAITATTISNVVVTGAITASNAYDSFETVGKAVPRNLRYKPLVLYCAEQLSDWYNHDRATTYPGDNAQLHPEYKLYRLRDRSNITIMPVPEMEGSQRLILAQENNLSLDMDGRNATGPELVYHPKNVKEIQVLMKASAGMSITMPAEVTVNDQA